MGKNKGKGSDVLLSMSNLKEEQKRLEKKIKQVAIPCSHTNERGKLKGEFIRDAIFKCKKCQTAFDMDRIQRGSLNEAIKLIHNAINQVKVFTNDPVEESSIIRSLGELDYNLAEFAEIYSRTLDENGKGNKKKKNNRDYDDNDDFGSYGYESLKFAKGNNKKRRNNW